uniref:Late embryogenesis abundant protein LEA-2 subgroup domain-containing protein n=1 Tax=Arundo donax TaxID=35708 RepID=A0A0A8ZD90_ARUDO
MIPSPWSRWSAKQYIIAALLGALVAAALVAVISITLAPAHISFSIAGPTMSKLQEKGEKRKGVYYNFTLVANNPSRRMAVSYSYLSTKIWPNEAAWIPAEVNTSAALPGWQPPGKTTDVTVLAESWQYDQTTDAPKQDIKVDNNNCTVAVEAKVRFKFGLARTMGYTVRATCLHVNFIKNAYFPVPCLTA